MMSNNSTEEQNPFFYDYDPESVASKLVIAFFFTDVILGTLIYFAGGLKQINRWLLHTYYCYSLSGSVLTVLLTTATMGLSARGWFTLNTSALNLIIGALTILGCCVTIALQIHFVLILRKEIVERFKSKFMKVRAEIEYPVKIDEETVEKEKG
ncbi:hypothetical protein PYW08_011575 [Mythimna loreyi]|uniref:Uncharacterized protein n=1 Tax=Mythimna loreyi TaxID=667449 RepID=A0ACC2QJT8_9NEOP|nr:hypothetical protein PYW08_011575 [Mythimna loreyi]